MAKKTFDAVATIGKYTDRQGNEKKRYVTVGSVFEDDQGRMSMKLDAVPAGPEWSGWISFFVPREREVSPEQEAHSKAKGNAFVDDDSPY